MTIWKLSKVRGEIMAKEEREFYTPAEVAKRLGCPPYYINVKAKNGTLPFPCFISGEKRPCVKIPKEAFEKFMKGGEQ